MPVRAKSRPDGTGPGSSSEDPDFAAIRTLAASLHGLHQQMAASHAPIVHRLIQSRSRDPQAIEHTLDRLLDCACIPEGLALFKALCRYYYSINPAATAGYVHAYRDLWDSECGQNEAPPKESAK